MTSIIEIRPHRGGWASIESEGVRPYFTGPDAKTHALDYATGRMKTRRGAIRVYDAAGNLEQTLEFSGDATRI